MSMRVLFSPEARQEFDEADQYYNRQVPKLGINFARRCVLHCHGYKLGPCRSP